MYQIMLGSWMFNTLVCVAAFSCLILNAAPNLSSDSLESEIVQFVLDVATLGLLEININGEHEESNAWGVDHMSLQDIEIK